MELTGLIQHMKTNRSKTVTIDCSIPKEYPGYVRTISIKKNYIVRIEFEVYGYDEGGITYFIEYENFDTLISSLQEYLGKSIEEWKNINQTGFYPEQVTDFDLKVTHKKIKSDLVNDKIKIPMSGIKTEISDGYWKNYYYKNQIK